MKCFDECDGGGRLLQWEKLENFLSLGHRNCLPHPHVSNARRVNEPLNTYLMYVEFNECVPPC